MADLLSLKIYDSDNGDLLNDFDSPYRYGRCSLVFSPDGTLLARTGTDKSIPIWNTQSSTLIADLPSESHMGSFSEHHLWFAAGLSDESNGIHLWKLPAQRIGASPENPNADKKLPWQAVGRVVDGKGNSLSPNTTVVSHNDSKEISGTVVGPDNQPVADFEIIAHGGSGAVVAKSNERGEFRFQVNADPEFVMVGYHLDHQPWYGRPKCGEKLRILLRARTRPERIAGTRPMAVRMIDSRTAEPIPEVIVSATRWEGPAAKTFAGKAVSDQPIVPDILGVDRRDHENVVTDAHGYFRCLVSPKTWSYMIAKLPDGYDSLVSIDGKQEVELEAPVGGKTEFTFQMVKTKASAERP